MIHQPNQIERNPPAGGVRRLPIEFIFMPVKLIKLKTGQVRVTTPGGVKAIATTPAKAESQRRLLEGVEHGWKPTRELRGVKLTDAQVARLEKIAHNKVELAAAKHRNPSKMPLDDIVAQGPPLYKLHDLWFKDGTHLKPFVPVAMFPNATLHQVDFKFWGLNSYDAHIAFPSLRGAHTTDFERPVHAIGYQIVIFGEGTPSITAMYKHVFKDDGVVLSFRGLTRPRRALIGLYNALQDLPKLPNGWQYLQFLD